MGARQTAILRTKQIHPKIMATPTSQIELEARQTVLDQIVAGASFTGYEITLEVRRRLGATVDVPHPVVNGVVQTMFSSGEIIGYDRAPDPSVKAATPPFRYSPKTATQRQSAPVAPAAVIAVNRKNLPINLRYSNPVAAVIREYALEARASHDAAGKGDIPFDVFLPTTQNPTFRVRSFGAVPSETEIEARYSLTSASQTDIGSKAAYAYVNEFRVSTFQNGTAKTFRCALDATLQGIVTKDGEVATNQADGVEIEVPVNASTVGFNFFGREAAPIFAFFRTPPRVQSGALFSFRRGEIAFKGQGWRITSDGGTLAVVGDVAFPINALSFLPHNSLFHVEIDFAPGELKVSENGESLDLNPSTQAAISNAFKRVEDECVPLVGNHISSAPDIWEAKVRFTQLENALNNLFRRIQQDPNHVFQWNGIAIQSSSFEAFNGDITILLTSPASVGTRLRTQRPGFVTAQSKTVVFFNDLNTRTGSPSRLREFFAAHPDVERAYTLTFVSDDDKQRFITDNHFESVPTRLLSSLPKPASTQSNTPRTTNRIPFDKDKHIVLPPRNLRAASFGTLDEKEFNDLELWARETCFDGKNWPDWKRLHKQLETRVWPDQSRFRWNKTEADVPSDSPLASERESRLLGAMMGQLDSLGVKRGDDHQFPNGGPNARTIAYLKRRAEKLLRFLRDGTELSADRRDLLAPLVLGSMKRTMCESLRDTLAFRLGFGKGELFDAKPDFVRGLWNDATLALPILKWAFDWLRSHDETVEGTTQHVRRFAQAGEADVVLAILPALLASGTSWFKDYGWPQLSVDLQSRGGNFWEKRGEVLRLFARFSFLKPKGEWLLSVLDVPEADNPEVVRFVTSLISARARNGELALAKRLSPILRKVFFDALIAARPAGLSLSEWQTIDRDSLVESLAPALLAMPMSREVADYLWLRPSLNAEFIRLGGEARWIEALAPMIQNNAQKEDFAFALMLPPLGREQFFQILGSNVTLSTWQKLGALNTSEQTELAPNIARLPLSDAFWSFAGALESEAGARWLEIVNRERAETEFKQMSPSTVQGFLESNTNTLNTLIEAWLEANVSNLTSEDALLLGAATSLHEGFRVPALARLRQLPLNLRSALRLMESGLPNAMSLARPFFEEPGDEWAPRVLALADSPQSAARQFALDLLARFPDRWTSALLQQLAEHDDVRVQEFVAARLNQAPQNETISGFQNAILNGRGRARRAKVYVQREPAGEVSLDVLLDAARNGAPRDRAWALQQLVKLQLNGIEVPDLKVRGALAQSE